jgi:hypothetical protein
VWGRQDMGRKVQLSCQIGSFTIDRSIMVTLKSRAPRLTDVIYHRLNDKKDWIMKKHNMLILLPLLVLLVACSGRGKNGESVQLPPLWTPTPIAGAGMVLEEGTWLPCNDGPPSKLELGDTAMIEESSSFSIRLRGEPGLSGTIIGSVVPGDLLEVTNGPACFDQLVWWEVRSLGTGDSGWTAEGNTYGPWILRVE